jgi:hypothetical protein
MANINMNLELICNLRKRQQLFAMPSFRATTISPYPQYTEQQLNMRRKAEILQYAGNRMNTKTNSLTQTGRYAQVISGKYQPRPYTTTYTETASYVFDNVLQMDRVVITRTPVYSNPDPTCPLDNMIPVPTSSSDVPGPIINLYNDTSIPLYNYAVSADRSYAITDVIETENFKTKNADANTYAFYTITADSNGLITETEPSEITISTIYVTNIVDSPQYVYELYLPIGIHFEGKYKTTTMDASFGSFGISIPSSGFNPQVIFGTNAVTTNRIVSFHNNQTYIRDISFNVTNKSADFSGTIYIGMLKITNIDLYTAPGYIYDINILTDKILTANSPAEKEKFISRYEFKYGLYYNISDANKKIVTNCTIAQNASTEPLEPIQLLESSSPT